MTVSIVIPNYNTWDLVKRNIDALLKYDRSHIAEVIVVDDASPDKNPYVFDNPVRVIRNSRNLHYAKTVNAGISQSSGDIIIILDSDAYPIHAFISKTVSHFKDPKVGCVGFKTVDEAGIDTGNVANEPSYLSLLTGQQLHKHLKRFDFRKKKYMIPFSCAVAFRRECIEKVGLFDSENFPVLMADYDLCISLNKLGYSTVYDSSILIFHKGGVSIPRNYKRVILFYEARWAFLKKHRLIQRKKGLRILIEVRFGLEYIIFRVAAFFQNEYREKAHGRKEIIKAIKHLI